MTSQLFAYHRSCTWRCRSHQHTSQLASAITKSASISDEQLKIYSAVTCPNGPKSIDSLGRTLVHWTASCDGRTELLEWFVDEFGAEVDAKDSESGYTPLHRALLHGQLGSAQALIDRDASLNVLDREGLSPLDIVRRDQGIGAQCFTVAGRERQDAAAQGEWFSVKGPTEVYSCGENVTSNLGHRVPKERSIPELVDFFPRRGLSVEKVVMSKWHTAFLTMVGAVYTCGHGSFGRLGHGDLNDRTVPTLVKVPSERIVSVGVGDEHTVVVAANGSAWAWGGNRRRQLGVASAAESVPAPALVTLTKNTKDQTFLGCACCASYTILWTNDTVYGCGANEGQFGRCASKTDTDLHPLRHVVGVASPLAGLDLLDIACGETAIAVLTKKFEVLLLQNFDSRRILSRLLNFTRVFMNSTLSKKSDRHGQQQQHQTPPVSPLVRLTLFSQGGFMYYWDTKDQQLRNCTFTGSVSKMIYPHSACTFGDDGLFLVTEDGKLYKGRIRNFTTLTSTGDGKSTGESEKSFATPKSSVSGKDDKMKTSKSHAVEAKAQAAEGKTKRAVTTDFKWTSSKTLASRVPTGSHDGISPLDALDYQVVSLSTPTQAIHRGIFVSAASDGRNYCVIQQDPKADLVELPIKSSSTLSVDYGTLLQDAHSEDCLHDIQVRTSENGAQFRALHKYILCARCPYFSKRIQQSTAELQIDEPAHVVTEFALSRILEYVYTDDCDIFHAGPYSPAQNWHDHIGSGDSGVRFGEGKKSRDPVREVLEASKRLNMKALTKRLETLRWDSSTTSILQVARNPSFNQRLRFEPNAFPELCDVRLECKDGVHIAAHRCVLSARAEYFRCMFATGFWSETSRNQTLKVDVESSVLTPVLHYLYSDELPPYFKAEKETAIVNKEKDLYATTDKEMLEHYGKILVCADQWLLDRLRELCEIELAARITLRNATDMLEFASAINADQLFASCAQFISLNLCALLEANSLRHLSSECLRRVGAYYRDLFPHVGHRALTPSSEPPGVSDIEAVWNDMLALGLSPDDVCQEYVANWTQHQLAAGSPTASAKKKRSGGPVTPRARRTSTNTSISENTPETPDSGAKKANVPIATSPLGVSKAVNIIPVQGQKASWGGAGKANVAVTTGPEPATIPAVVSKPIAVPSAGHLPSRSKNKPWNLALSPTEFPPEVSLRDLMQAEEKKQAVIVSERRKSNAAAVAIHRPSPVVDQKSPVTAWTSTSPPSFASVSRPMAPLSPELLAFSPPTTSEKKQAQKFGGNRTFDEIVKEEKSKEATRARILNKPLKIIQDEELAMQELALIYQVDDEWDEYITVERAVAIVSEPTWQAHVGSPPRF